MIWREYFEALNDKWKRCVQVFAEGGFEFHNSLESPLSKVIALYVCMVCLLSCWWWRLERVFFCTPVTLRSIWKTQGWMEPLQVFEISCSGLYANTANTHIQTHTHGWRHSLICKVQKVHVEKRIHTNTPPDTHTHRHTHTKKAKTSTYTWWVFDHQLSSHSLSGCLVTKVLISSSSMNPHHHLTALSTRCHLVCTWVFCYKLTLLFSWI